MKVPPEVLAEARVKATRHATLIQNTWNQLISDPLSDPRQWRNARMLVQRFEPGFALVQNSLSVVLIDFGRWNVRENFDPQFVDDIQFWSTNLNTAVNASVINVHSDNDHFNFLESIRGTLNYVIDPYNMGGIPELPPKKR